MKKRSSDVMSPREFYSELQTAIRQLGELATALGVSLPKGAEDIESLSRREILDLWSVSSASRVRLDEAWDDTAAYMVRQALETGSSLPDSNEPRA